MGKQTVNQTKKVLAILLVVLFVLSLTAVAANARGNGRGGGLGSDLGSGLGVEKITVMDPVVFMIPHIMLGTQTAPMQP
jgi:hypothetical protein